MKVLPLKLPTENAHLNIDDRYTFVTPHPRPNGKILIVK